MIPIWQGVLFLVGVVLLVLAGIGVKAANTSLTALAAAFALLGFGLPYIGALWAVLT